MIPLRKIFHYTRKIVELFVFLARTKLASKKIARLRKKQSDLIREMFVLKEKKLPIKSIEMQIADLNHRITKLTKRFSRLYNGKSKGVYPKR